MKKYYSKFEMVVTKYLEKGYELQGIEKANDGGMVALLRKHEFVHLTDPNTLEELKETYDEVHPVYVFRHPDGNVTAEHY